MQKKLIGFICLSFLLLSCNTTISDIVSDKDVSPVNNKRNAILGFQLGMSKSEVNALHEEYIKSQQFKIYNGEFAYMENPFIFGHVYYSGLVYRYPPGDTTLAQISVYFGDVINEYFKTSVEVNAGSDRYFMRIDPESGITNQEIVDDIISKVSKNYGPFTSTDTLQLSDETQVTYKWLDKDDVNIKLKHSYFSAIDPLIEGVSRYYIINLDYKYTDEMYQKLNLKKSIF